MKRGALFTFPTFMNPYKLLSVQVGVVQPLFVDPHRVMSGIRKHPIQGAVRVHPLGIDGDEQADLTVHGGLAKAIYAYPVEHYAFWQQQKIRWGLPPDVPHGSMGENLTVSGVLEEALFVGDELHFPDCVLRVTQPREPCYKWNALMGSHQAAKIMVQTDFCGFYLAVAVPGFIASGQTFEWHVGARQVPLMALYRAAPLKTRSD